RPRLCDLVVAWHNDCLGGYRMTQSGSNCRAAIKSFSLQQRGLHAVASKRQLIDTLSARIGECVRYSGRGRTLPTLTRTEIGLPRAVDDFHPQCCKKHPGSAELGTWPSHDF